MFVVVWHNSALDSLADAFVTADLPTRDEIEQAVTRLNRKLVSDPESLGESRPGEGRRITFDSHCAIRFKIDRGSGVVEVTQFWTY